MSCAAFLAIDISKAQRSQDFIIRGLGRLTDESSSNHESTTQQCLTPPLTLNHVLTLTGFNYDYATSTTNSRGNDPAFSHQPSRQMEAALVNQMGKKELGTLY